MAKVLAGQQRRGGGGEKFEPQVRHTSGKKKKKSKDIKNPPSKNKYAGLVGISPKQKPNHPNGWMRDCRCKGAGTCSVCLSGPAPIAPPSSRSIPEHLRALRRSYNYMTDNEFLRYWGYL